MQSKTSFYTATDAATVDFDFQNSVNQQVTLGGNRTFIFSNPVAGSVYHIKIIQDGTGSRTVTWPASVEWAASSAPTLTTTAAHVDLLTFLYDGSDYLEVARNLDFTV